MDSLPISGGCHASMDIQSRHSTTTREVHLEFSLSSSSGVLLLGVSHSHLHPKPDGSVNLTEPPIFGVAPSSVGLF